MRCLFTMFAEDVRLLRERIFSNAFGRWLEDPEVFPSEVEDLWTKMDRGGTLWGGGRIWRFNGGLFADPVGLPLDRQQLQTLQRAAESDWADVEPAIFGTLLERALDPHERHRLGAHYTPRAYVERLVRPTIEEPLRNEWETVRATVRLLLASPDADMNRKTMSEARVEVARFLERLTQVRILDPACGTGNFLYVSLDALKRLENEALELYEQLGGAKLTHYGRLVSPQQFLGIEIKRWAKEIAELVLWIGYLQWQVRTKGFEHPDEPILRDYHNIECRDALLDYDEKVPLLDDDGLPVTRWDGVTMKRHTVTGEEVPDDTARVPVYRYVNARKAKWPEAEFIVGNPPYIGARKIRSALGDGYVDALRSVYDDVPETADFVMYWWREAAAHVRAHRSSRFGLITTNSLNQNYSRPVLERHLTDGGSILFAIPDHPWVESRDGAAVRVAMTVGVGTQTAGSLGKIVSECGETVEIAYAWGKINGSLTIGADIKALQPLLANQNLCFQGVVPAGDGFKLTAEEAAAMDIVRDAAVLPKYLIGRDLVQCPQPKYIIDFFGIDELGARIRHPALYQHLLDHVWPERTHNPRSSYREKWWLFAEPRPAMRAAMRGLRRYIGTPYTAKHRAFIFIKEGTLPDAMVYAITSDAAYLLAVLSSRVHLNFCLSAGGSLEDRPRYNSKATFLPFPFPDPPAPLRRRLDELGERLDSHRKRQQSLHPDLTITAMYNVLEKLRSGVPLTSKDKVIHEKGLVSILKQLHDDLDTAVFDAYGWPHELTDEEILERLVALNAERAEEERRGVIRWLRPDFQNAGGTTAAQQAIATPDADAPEPRVAEKQARAWPKALPAQVAAVRELVTHGTGETWSAERTARAFKGARRAQVEAVLESLSALGLLIAIGDGDHREWKLAT